LILRTSAHNMVLLSLLFIGRKSIMQSREVGALRYATRLSFVVIVAALVGIPYRPAAAAVPMRLVYRVSHSALGDLGSYVYAVEPLGSDATKVLSQEHIAVRMFGVPVYREDAKGTERWRGNRLVSFDGVTHKTGGLVEVTGRAQGDGFVITSPRGIVMAPATVHPADPCAANFLTSTTILRPDTGGLEQVHVSGGNSTLIRINGATVPVHEYVVDGRTRYTVWLDAHDLPVMFVVDDNAGQATFTLAKCAPCDSATSQPR
jgi:hypothetical protein